MPSDNPTPEPTADQTVPDPVVATDPSKERGAAQGESIGKNAAYTFIGTLASRMLGMVRESLIAATFSKEVTDVFFVAWRVPNALRALLAEGAASAALGPSFSEALKHKDDRVETSGKNAGQNLARLREVIARVGAVSLLVLAIATGAGMLFARPIFRVVSGGFSGDTQRFEMGVTLLRVLFPFLFLMGWFSLGRTALERLGDFKTGSAASVYQNVAFVLAPFVMVPFAPLLGIAPITMMAVAAVLGAVLQSLYLRPALSRLGLLVRPRLQNDPALSDVGKIFLTMLYGQAVYQCNVILAARWLSSLEPGSASWNSYAQRLADIPQGLFTVSLVGAAAVEMERFAVQNDRDSVARTFERTLRMSALVALPACVLLAVYGSALVNIVFAYGRFSQGVDAARNVREVTRSLEWQSMTVLLFAFIHPAIRMFSSFKNRKPVLIASTIGMIAFAATGPWLLRTQGHVGVAMAGTIGALSQLTVLMAMAVRWIPVRAANVLPTLAKISFATGIAALFARAATRWLPVAGTSWPQKLLAMAVGAVVLVLYVATAWLIRTEEIQQLVTKVQNRIRPRKR